MDRRRVKEARQSSLSHQAQSLIPQSVANVMVTHLGNDAYAVLDEWAITLAENKEQAPPLMAYETESGDVDTYRYGILHTERASYRATDAIKYETIEDMLANGQVLFGLSMKTAWLKSVFRNDRSWDVECPDEKIKDVVRAMLKRVLTKSASDFMQTIPYGNGFFEKVWDYKTARAWGIEQRKYQERFYGYHNVLPIHPQSIDKILYTPDGNHFGGFVQKRTYGPKITVKPEQALILTHNKKFRNLWGESALEPVYTFWFWYEVALRSFLRYLERTGTPVTVCEAPAQGQIRKPDGTLISTMKYAFLLASNVAKSNAVALPSNVDPDSGEKLWNLKYLADDKRGDQFVKAIELLGTLIIRALIIGDRAATQGSETGSYAAAQQHFAVTMLHAEEVLNASFINPFNSYLVKPLVMHNFGANAPPALMVTEGLDPQEKERLFTLLNTMGNQAGAQSMDWIDWVRIMAVENIPTLSKEDYEALQKEKVERQEENMEMQQKFAARPDDGKKPPPTAQKKPDEKKKAAEKKVKASADWVLYNIAQGVQAPLMLSGERAREIAEEYQPRPFVLALEGEALTKSEMAAVKKELLSQLEIPEDADEVTRNAIWELVLKEVLSESETLEMSEELFETLETYTGTIELGLKEWLVSVVKKAKALFKKVVKAVTGKIANLKDRGWRKTIEKAHKDIARRGATVIIDKQGREWREADHPRDESGKFAKKGDVGEKEDVKDEKEPGEEESTGEKEPVLKTDKFKGLTFSKSVTESQRKVIEEAVSFALQDEYLQDASGEMFVGTYDELRKKHPHVFAGMPRVSGFYHPATGNVYVATDGITDEFLPHVVFHEMTHSVETEKRSPRNMPSRFLGSASMEEACTELITGDMLKKYYGRATNAAYQDEISHLTRLLRNKYQGDKGKMMKEVYNIHNKRYKEQPLRVLHLAMSTFPELTLADEVFFRGLLTRPGSYITGEMNVIYMMAMKNAERKHGSKTDAFHRAIDDYLSSADYKYLWEKRVSSF